MPRLKKCIEPVSELRLIRWRNPSAGKAMQAWDIAIFCFLHVPPPRCIHDREMLVCLTFHFATAFLGSGKFSSWSCLARRRFYTKPSLNTAPLCVVRFLWLTWNVCAMLEMITHFLAVSFAVKSLAGPVTRGLATIGVWGGGGEEQIYERRPAI